MKIDISTNFGAVKAAEINIIDFENSYEEVLSFAKNHFKNNDVIVFGWGETLTEEIQLNITNNIIHNYSLERIQRKLKEYLEECKPYDEALAKIKSLKIPLCIKKVTKNEVIFDYGDDLPIEIELKERLKKISQKYNIEWK